MSPAVIDEMLVRLRRISCFLIYWMFTRRCAFRDPNDLIQVMKDIFSNTKCPFVILIDEWDCLFREYKQDQRSTEESIWIFCGHG